MTERLELFGRGSSGRVVLAPYDPAWPRRFEAERVRILAALGPRALRVEHIGSTSVPGLAAKPIVDVQLSVRDVEDEDDYLPALIAAGYELRVREPDHRLVRIFDEVHVHVCTAGSRWERRHLLFRDRLRADAEDRELYERTKRELAKQQWPTRNHYADAKSDVVAEITERAEGWAEATGWRPEEGQR